jgi:hypothetical protein
MKNRERKAENKVVFLKKESIEALCFLCFMFAYYFYGFFMFVRFTVLFSKQMKSVDGKVIFI